MYQPQSSPYADFFTWKSVVTIPLTTANSPVATDVISDQLQFLSDSFFCLMAFTGSTNYDNYFASVPIGGAAQIQGARYPNNFSVLVTQNLDQKMMSAPMPQACLCSSGYMDGHQLPYPVLFPPMTSINLDYAAINPFNLFTSSGHGTVIPLDISFGLAGFNVPTENLDSFLASFSPMMRKAKGGDPLWLKNFTSMPIPGLTS